MTHVFVAPHPDDVALSCGGLIASLRALGFGNKAVWPALESFNRSHIAADYPVYAEPDVLPAWAATDDRLEATQVDADAAAKRFWQRSSWYRRASIRSESLAGQPVMDV